MLNVMSTLFLNICRNLTNIDGFPTQEVYLVGPNTNLHYLFVLLHQILNIVNLETYSNRGGGVVVVCGGWNAFMFPSRCQYVIVVLKVSISSNSCHHSVT